MLERNKIYCGDCAKVMLDIDDNNIDLTVTSPPYDNLRTYDGYNFNFKAIARELYRVTKEGGVAVWIVGDATIDGSETGTSFNQVLYFKEIGFRINDTMIWNKGSFTATGALPYRYAQVFEYMFIFTKGKIKKFNPIMDRVCKTKGESIKGTIRQRDGSTRKTSNWGKIQRPFGQRFNIWECSPTNSNKERTGHPAQFPESLIGDHIISWSNEGDLVLDPMCGSGTTCKMARFNNRNYIGIDISEKYCKIGRKRLQKMSAPIDTFTNEW